MTLLASAPQWLAIILFLLLAFAALEDLWRLEIADWTCAGVALLAFLALAIDGPMMELWQNLLMFALVLGVGTLLFVRGWMGGGDVKLLAASALWFDLDQGWKMLVAVSLAGGIETLLMLLLRRLPMNERIRASVAFLKRGEAIPYGLAIATGMAVMGLLLR